MSLLEVCVDTYDDALAARDAGADRLELCSALGVGGLTPSIGLMRKTAGIGIPVFAMIRPRDGSFTYGPNDVQIMRDDIEAAKDAGLDGIVTGALTANGDLDETVLAKLLDHAAPLPVTLHRAFDLVRDPETALERAIALGFKRILTSGQTAAATDGTPLIAELITKAAGRITIMPGSGINPANVEQIMRRTRAAEIHASCSAMAGAVGKLVELGFVPESGHRAVDPARVTAMKKKMQNLQESVQ
ncbi:copper homeostasis protein CutC [Qingshengfaniella alkalisoli]|uniref:PF03932 family protein CutC n=1 Tax=Qingshengfaniella alkalisoli TaxID=2599296 RepID=A0A5B8J285_9RHOB|nr:copper homeostasis protein CutC [Qingshengfaniella alkalisoli]QDY70898.1 copper homeostasis protein CutC [Qingshengfaniella alkalisoli]